MNKISKYIVLPATLATSIVAGGCDLEETHPIDGIGTYTGNFQGLKSSYDNDFWKLSNAFMKGEGKGHGLSENNAESGRIIKAYNPSIKNPFEYNGKITLPDLNGDGKVLGRNVNGFHRKTVPRTGKGK